MGTDDETTAAPPPPDETLDLNEPLEPPPRKRKSAYEWIMILRPALIGLALLVLVPIGIVAYQHRDSLFGRPAPLPAEYQAWIDRCNPIISQCYGDLVFKKDGTTWFVGAGRPQDDAAELGTIISSRFADVEDIVRLDDPDYLEKLGEYLGRTEPQVPAAPEDAPPEAVAPIPEAVTPPADEPLTAPATP